MRATARCLTLALAGATSLAAAQEPAPGGRPYREAALEVGRWLEAVAVPRPSGKAWRADPAQDGPVVHHLYSGTAGVVLFLLELHHATGDPRWLALAEAGADAMAAEVGDGRSLGAGLYTGAAGVAFALEETFRSSGAERHRAAARAIGDAILADARMHGAGVDWGDVTDVISGTAGTGFFLLYAAERWQDPRARDLAVAAGRRLLDQAEATDAGRRWRMSPTYERWMPNFSHGTGGVACFLATLPDAEGREGFLEAAQEGARHLESLARTRDGTFAIPHHFPGGEDLYYLGWCHGPVGTARLFQVLFVRTGDPRWSGRITAAARTLLQSGIPEQATPGFWNNVGQCCGSAGVAAFFLDLERAGGPESYRAFARRMLDDVLARATREERGVSWVQAEHRVRPELLQAQTGYMQGAAGIGLALLQLDGADHGRAPRVVLPDAPFPSTR